MKDETNPPTGAPLPRRKWRRRLGKGVLWLLVLLLVGGLLAWRWLQSASFNRYVAGQVEQAGKDYGLQIKVGDFGWSWEQTTATLRDLTVINQTTGQPIATVEEATLSIEFLRPYTRREAILRSLKLSGVKLHVDINERGETNFAGLRQPPKKEEFLKLITDQLTVALTGSQVLFIDRARQVLASLHGVQGEIAPITASVGRYRVKLNANGKEASYEGRSFALEEFVTAGTLDAQGWEVADFQLRTALGQMQAAGKLDNWRAPQLDFTIKAKTELADLLRVVAPGNGGRGHLQVEGKLTGSLVATNAATKAAPEPEAAPLRFVGQASSPDLQVAQTRGRELVAQDVSVTLQKGNVNFAAPRVRASNLTVSGVQMIELGLSGMKGDVVNGRTKLTAINAHAGRVAWQGGQVTAADVRGLSFTLQGRQFNAAGTATIRGGSLSLGQRGQLAWGNATSTLTVDNETLNLKTFNASLLGGSAQGAAEIRFARQGVSQLQADFQNIATDNLLALGLVKPEQVLLKGNVNGTAQVSFPNHAPELLSGTITADFSGTGADAAGSDGLAALPLTGRVALQAERGVFTVPQLNFKTDVTTLEGTGVINVLGTAVGTPAGDSDFTFKLSTSDASQLTQIARAFPAAQKLIAEYEPLLTGELTFNGRVTGNASAPLLQGELQAATIGMKDALLGSLAGNVFVTPQQLRIDNGLLTAGNGGTIKFALATPLDVGTTDAAVNTGTLTATIDRIELETLLGVAGAPAALDFIAGDVAGEVRVTGLPNAMQGGGKLNLLNARVLKQPAELAQVAFKVDGQTVTVERLEARLMESSMLASGTVNLQDKRFAFTGQAKQVRLARLAEALEVTATAQISGVADADFQVSGATDKLDDLRVTLTANSPNVQVNGADTGALKLTARTSEAGRIEAELVTGMLASVGGKPEIIRGSIELRKAGKPISIESNLIDLDVATVLTLFAPQYAALITGKLNGRLQLSGPITDEKGAINPAQLRGGLVLNGVELAIQDNALTVATPFEIKLVNGAQGQQLALAPSRITGRGIDLVLGGVLGWQNEAQMDFALNGTVQLADLPPPNEDLRLDGAIIFNEAHVRGTVEAPTLSGEILLQRIGVAVTDAPASITAGNGRIVLNGNKAQLESFKAAVNDGSLELNGALDFAGLKPKEWKFNIKASAIDVIYDEVRANLNGNLQLTGTPQGQQLSGRADVTQAEYTGEIDLDGITTGRVVSSTIGNFSAPGIGRRDSGLPPITLNLRVDARDSVIIRDDEINTVATALLTVTGPLSEPNLTGRVAADGGTVRFRGQRYDVTTATLDLLGGGGAPVLNLRAEGNTSGYRVYMGFLGPLDQIELSLRAEPDLTRDEILSLITTGRTESRTIGGADPLRSSVGTAASLLTTQVTKSAEKALGIFGINRFQIDPVIRPNTNPAARATIGAQLARSLYFTFSTNLSAEPFSTALLEYTLSNNFSTIASFTQGGSAVGQGVTRNNDFTLEIRGRKRFSLGFNKSPEPNLAATDPTTTTTAPPANPTVAAPTVPGVPPRIVLPEADVQVVTPLKELSFNNRLLRELLPVKEQGFSRSLVRLGERRLRTYLQERGYFFAEVSTRCEPVSCQGNELKLFYDVQPGERYRLLDMRLEGVETEEGAAALALNELRGELQSQEASAIPFIGQLPLLGGFKRGITSNERVRADAELLRRTLNDRGYREARVRSRFAVTEDNGLVIVFAVDKGVQVRVAEIVVRGNTLVNASELRRAVPIENGTPFSPTQATLGSQQIRQHYVQRGFLEANTTLEVVELTPTFVQLVYQVEEGVQARLEDVVVTGTTKTRLNWVRRYYDFRKGEVVTPNQIRNTQRDLYATGAFREVSVRSELLDPNTGAHRLHLNLTEAKPLLFVYGVGYSTDVGARGLLELTNTNIAGTLDAATLRLRGSRREQFAQFLFTDLRPFNTRWPTTFSVFYHRNSDLRPFTRRRESIDGQVREVADNALFGLQRFAAYVQTERRFNDQTSLRLRYNLERARLFNFEQNFSETEVTRNERAVRLGSFGIGITKDTRDNLLNPTRGYLASADNLIATRWLGGNESFNKFTAAYQRFHTFAPRPTGLTSLLQDTTLAFSARLGLGQIVTAADRNGDGIISASERQLPISERFFAGGATTLRGFRFETAGPQGILAPRPVTPDPGKPNQARFELPTLVPLGGDALTVFNVELRYPLTPRLRLVTFYDVGNVFARINAINWAGMTNTVGLGLRYNTPLGPIGVDYGFLLDPPAFMFNSAQGPARLQQPRGAFHIRFGQSF